LHHHSYAALQSISCDFHDGVLVLRGRLASYYLVQLAQAVVSRLEGIRHIENLIEVNRTARS
jgi:hypothetical protein